MLTINVNYVQCVTIIFHIIVRLLVSLVWLRGFAKLKKFQKSQKKLEVGGWVQVSFG